MYKIRLIIAFCKIDFTWSIAKQVATKAIMRMDLNKTKKEVYKGFCWSSYYMSRRCCVNQMIPYFSCYKKKSNIFKEYVQPWMLTLTYSERIPPTDFQLCFSQPADLSLMIIMTPQCSAVKADGQWPRLPSFRFSSKKSRFSQSPKLQQQSWKKILKIPWFYWSSFIKKIVQKSSNSGQVRIL